MCNWRIRILKSPLVSGGVRSNSAKVKTFLAQQNALMANFSEDAVEFSPALEAQFFCPFA